ncbi:MAG TPA: hypothetical protein VM408_03435 [Methylomirabilota bacterium]|nr:hypothetical protein [Methylomirabilota bacterium]
MTRGRVPTVLLAVVAAVGLLGMPVGPTAPLEVRAATPDLTIVSTARYDVQPDKQRVRVTVDLVLHNRLKDTTTKRYYFDHAFLDVLPRVSGLRLTTGGKSASVSVVRKSNAYTRLQLKLAGKLFSGKSARYRLTFNVTDPGGAATRDLRIGDSLVSFPVWAFATESTPGSSVTVVFPAGYEVKVEAGKIPAGRTDDTQRTIFRTGRLDRPLDFFAYLVADRPGAYKDATVATEVLDAPVDIHVRSWQDDAPWAKRVTGLLKVGLPALGDRIGLDWPAYEQPLTVQEAVSRTTGGYAGLFDPAAGKVEIAYYADDFVVLHEAAHAWFNGSLLADRWANEAFASYYATAAAADVKRKIRVESLTDELKKARIPLNAWGPVGSEDVAQEDYAYAASLTLAKEIAKRAGREGLTAVWTAARAGVGAYQPVGGGAAETVDSPPDWRGLLDLFEEETDATYDDLWREWVARDTDTPLLDGRTETRTRYEALVAAADDWHLPRPIRDAMRAWRFSDATALLSDAEVALAGRGQVSDAAAAAGLTAPATLRLAFEDDDGFADSTAETAAELDVIARYVAAEGLRPAEITPFLTLGLWGQTPDVQLEASRTAFAMGDLQASASASADAARTWSNAEALGQSRTVSIGLIVLAVLFGLAVIIGAARRWRRRRVTMQARRSRG